MFSIFSIEQASSRICTIVSSFCSREMFKLPAILDNQVLTRIPFDERLEPSVIGRLVSVLKFNMADLINFISKREIDAKKEETRKAREQILKKVSLLGGRSIKMLEKLSQSRRNAFHRKASCISHRVLLKVLLFGALDNG